MRAGAHPAAILATMTVVIVAFLLAERAAGGPDFNPDESRWTSRAHYLADLSDPFGPTWDDQYMTRGQPPLGSYVMGLGLLAQGRGLDTNPPWDFSVPWDENIALGHKPVPEDLAAGRRTSAILVAATALVVIFVTRAFVSTPWAIAAAALFAAHPFTVYIGSIAMSDALFGLLLALSAWAAVALAQRPGWRQAVLLGSVLGLGGATKLSPLVLALGLSAASSLMVLPAMLRHKPVPQPAVSFARFGLVVGATAAVVFVASYPYLWPAPIDRTRHLFTFRAEEMAAQASDWPEMAVPTRLEALRRVGLNFTERYSFSTVLAPPAANETVLAPAKLVELTIPLIGVAIMAGLAVRDGPYSPRALAVAVLGGQAAITILGMHSEFDRYHVPMALLGAVGAAVALCWITTAARARWAAGPDASRSTPGRRAFGTRGGGCGS